jgi:hypothetical protein
MTALYDAVREAWSSVPAPPVEDLQYMAWGWGNAAAEAFVGVAPISVDIASAGFYAATPLLDLPPRAAAAYLGTYLLSLLRNLERQKAIGLFIDITTRAHTITCLINVPFWARVRPFLSAACRDVLVKVVDYLASEHEALALTPEDVDVMRVEARARH